MNLPEASHCPNCERLARRLAEQDAEIATLKVQLAQALARITQLEQQLAVARKDSSTSSKPPSSDIVKLKKPLPKGRKKRKKGGQPGHDHHPRAGHEARPELGETVPRKRGSVLPFHHDAGHRPDEQPGGASDSLRGH
jgi:uncharacterized coiled-coil protein SlyX